MSPSRLIEKSRISIEPIKHPSDKLCSVGAVVTGIDLNDITDEDVQALKAATHKHKVIIIKNQHDLQPIKQWELMVRLDPTSKQLVHGHGDVKSFAKTGGLLAVS